MDIEIEKAVEWHHCPACDQDLGEDWRETWIELEDSDELIGVCLCPACAETLLSGTCEEQARALNEIWNVIETFFGLDLHDGYGENN